MWNGVLQEVEHPHFFCYNLAPNCVAYLEKSHYIEFIYMHKGPLGWIYFAR
jgi:hypothetical protein